MGIASTPPPGGAFHAAAIGEDGNIRIFEVWDSREQAEAWSEKVAAARDKAGLGGSPPSIEYLEVHSIVQCELLVWRGRPSAARARLLARLRAPGHPLSELERTMGGAGLEPAATCV